MDAIFLERSANLADFTHDYISNSLTKGEKEAYEEYLSTNKKLEAFVSKAKEGKKALSNAYRMRAAENFEKKLAKRIAREANVSDTYEGHHTPV